MEHSRPAQFLKRLVRNLASVKLAVFILLSLATLIAIGTFVEASYDAAAAKKKVYDTFWMFLIMGILAINLIAVMVDRWPWKARHAPFVFAHIGILIIMFGAILTMEFGLDGSLRVGIGESNQFVLGPQTDLVVYSSFDGDRYTKLYDSEVDFYLHPPTEQKPIVVKGMNTDIQVVDYKPYVIPSRKVVAATDGSSLHGAGLRFQIQNPNVNVVEWIVQRRPKELATHNFGPAQLHLGEAPAKSQGANEIYFTPEGDHLKYVVFQKDQDKPLKTGTVKEGDVFNPGWKMPMDVRILRYLPQAEEAWDMQERERPTPLTTAAVRLKFQGKEHWLLLNDTLKLFTQDAVYLVNYGNRRIDLGFPLKLLHFEVDNYQGTMRAMAYKSEVSVPGIAQQEISMNEPLKYRGFTIYQASFQQDETTGQPIASVFSVNQDPGRWFKYLGSLIMTIGIILLFYFKKRAKRNA